MPFRREDRVNASRLHTEGSHPEEPAHELGSNPKHERGPAQFQHGQGRGCVDAAQVAWHICCADPPRGRCRRAIPAPSVRGHRSPSRDVSTSCGISLTLAGPVDFEDVQNSEDGHERDQDESEGVVGLEVEVQEGQGQGAQERLP